MKPEALPLFNTFKFSRLFSGNLWSLFSAFLDAFLHFLLYRNLHVGMTGSFYVSWLLNLFSSGNCPRQSPKRRKKVIWSCLEAVLDAGSDQNTCPEPSCGYD